MEWIKLELEFTYSARTIREEIPILHLLLLHFRLFRRIGIPFPLASNLLLI